MTMSLKKEKEREINIEINSWKFSYIDKEKVYNENDW